MVKVKEVLTGRVFGRLTVLEQVEDHIESNGEHVAMWLCECSCKERNKKVVRGAHLKQGLVKSCGCLQKEHAIKMAYGCKKQNVWLEGVFCDEYGEYKIGLTSNTNQEFYVGVEDFDLVNKYCWLECINKNGYSSLLTNIQGRSTKMTELLDCKYYDHKDRNPLNNRRCNLRPATFQENVRNCSIYKNNTSGIVGVGYRKSTNKWRAYINCDSKQISLGSYINKEDAIKARLQAEAKYFGEFAPQRHLFEAYGIGVNKKND